MFNKKVVVNRKMKKLFIFLLLLFSAGHAAYAYDAAGYAEKTQELKLLLSQCEAEGMKCPYEKMQITAMELFLDESVLSNTEYVSARMDEIYADTKSKLNDFIDGSAKPMQAPEYISSKTKIDGTSLIANTTWGERPVFFIGYGHFEAARKSFSKFSSLGANITQQELGPSSVIVEAKVPEWNFTESSNQGLKCDISINKDKDYARGTASAKFEMTENPNGGYACVMQSYTVEPNTEYTYSIQAMSSSSTSAYFSAGSLSGDKTFEQSTVFRKYSGTFKTGNETSQTFAIYINNPGTVYVDNISVVKKGSSDNLIVNGNFETDFSCVFGPNNEFAVNTRKIDDVIIPMLKSAEENNVAVSLLLSPHYFPSFVSKYYPDINIFHEQYTLIIDKYIEALITRVKDYTSLHDIVLTNEPTLNTAKYPELLPDYQNWLKERYNADLNVLNSAYNSDYKDFSEIPMPAEATEIPDNSAEKIPVGSQTRYFYDWMIYNNKKFASWHQHFAETVKKYMPDAKVHSKMQDYFDYYSNIDFARYRLTWGTEAEDFAEFSDLAGNDSASYYSWEGRHVEGQMKWYDYLVSVNEAPVFNSEDHIIEDYSTVYDTRMARFTRTDLFQGALHGRSASALWVWEQTSDSNSLFSGNALQRPDVVTAIGKTTLDLNRLALEVDAFNKKKVKTAILYSNTERVYNKDYLTVVDGIYKAALYAGQRIRFVTDNNLEKVSDYETLIVPNVSHISEKNLQIIQGFKNSGKKVILLGECFTKDEFDKNITFDSTGYIISSAPKNKKNLVNWSNLVYSTVNDTQVKICNKNDELVQGVEWNYIFKDGKVLVNVCNYSDNDLNNMKMYFNGEQVETYDLVSEQEMGISFTAKAYEPLILQYKHQSIVKSTDYSDGTVNLKLLNIFNDSIKFKAKIKFIADGETLYGGGISGDIASGEEVDFSCSSDESPDEVILQMLSNDGNVQEEWSIWKEKNY